MLKKHKWAFLTQFSISLSYGVKVEEYLFVTNLSLTLSLSVGIFWSIILTYFSYCYHLHRHITKYGNLMRLSAQLSSVFPCAGV